MEVVGAGYQTGWGCWGVLTCITPGPHLAPWLAIKVCLLGSWQRGAGSKASSPLHTHMYKHAHRRPRQNAHTSHAGV